MKGKVAPNYRDGAICRNCAYHMMGYFGSTIGYFCGLYEQRCNKTKVCDSYEPMDEDFIEQFKDW